MSARLAKLGAIAARFYLTSLLFAILCGASFCAGVFVMQRIAIVGVHQLEDFVKQKARAAR